MAISNRTLNACRRRHRTPAGSGQGRQAADRRGHSELDRTLRRRRRDHQAILEQALVDADREHEQREDDLENLSGRVREQRSSNQDAHQNPQGPGAEELEIQVAEHQLLARRRYRAREYQCHGGSHRQMHHDRMRHSKQRQEINEEGNSDDAPADAEQPRHEAGREAH
jgi:hypothetical protein